MTLDGRYNLATIRDEKTGELPSYSWPGAYPMFYLTESGLVVCPRCANDPDTSDPVVAYDTNWEDPLLICEDKGERIESAYADDNPETIAFDDRRYEDLARVVEEGQARPYQIAEYKFMQVRRA